MIKPGIYASSRAIWRRRLVRQPSRATPKLGRFDIWRSSATTSAIKSGTAG